MRYREFLSSGKRASVVAMGSTYFGLGGYLEGAFEILDAFVAIGGNCIDTARVYGAYMPSGAMGDSEKAIGLWLKARGGRESLVIGTKGGHPPMGDMHASRLDRASLEFDLSSSLEALGVDQVDVYWLHRDDPARPVGEILETLNGFVESGRTCALGASNWTAARILEANAYASAHGLAGFSASQPMWSLAACANPNDDTLVQMDRGMYAMHLQSGLICTPFSSQAKGFFMKLEAGTLSQKARERYDSPENQAIYERLRALSAKTGHTVGELQLAYLTSQPFPVFPIVGASSVAQVNALASACEVMLAPEDARYLRDMLAV